MYRASEAGGALDDSAIGAGLGLRKEKDKKKKTWTRKGRGTPTPCIDVGRGGRQKCHDQKLVGCHCRSLPFFFYFVGCPSALDTTLTT